MVTLRLPVLNGDDDGVESSLRVDMVSVDMVVIESVARARLVGTDLFAAVSTVTSDRSLLHGTHRICAPHRGG